MTIIAVVDTTRITETRNRILNMAAEMDLDSTVLIAAVADVVGLTMAVLNKNGAQHQRVGIDARLEVFCDRARETFLQTTRDMVEHKTISEAVAHGRLRT
jgi:hypothetical protein